MKIKLALIGVSLAIAACKGDDSTTSAAKSDFTLKGVGSADDATLRLTASGMDPEYLKTKIYGFYVSENSDCTDMVEVYSTESPEYEDMLEGVNYGEQVLADGTYECVAYKMGDTLEYAPVTDSANGGCEGGKATELEICRGNLSGEEYAGKHPDDEEFTCESGKEDIVTFYVSTLTSDLTNDEKQEKEECQGDDDGSETADCTAFLKPDADYKLRGINMADSIVKSGSMTGFIVIDGTGKVEEQDNNGSYSCNFEEPTFSFKSVSGS